MWYDDKAKFWLKLNFNKYCLKKTHTNWQPKFLNCNYKIYSVKITQK